MNVAEDKSVGDFDVFSIKLITEQTDGKILASIFVSYSNMIVLTL